MYLYYRLIGVIYTLYKGRGSVGVLGIGDVLSSSYSLIEIDLETIKKGSLPTLTLPMFYANLFCNFRMIFVSF